MKIRGIADLFAKPVERVPAQNSPQIDQSINQLRDKNPEAVKLASDFGKRVDDDEASKRESKVADLKAKVENGEYNPDSYKVATSVAQDLFA